MEKIDLQDLKECLKERNFTIFGHGTGYDNTEVIPSIFNCGLRASHTSMLYTIIGLDIDENLTNFKYKLDNWQHLDSENIILIKLPNDYFNIFGDSSDLDCERTRAFVNIKLNENNDSIYYLDPKFIIGVYNRNLEKVILNPNYELQLTDKTKNELQKKLDDAIEKTRKKNEVLLQQIVDFIPANNQSERKIEFDNVQWLDDFPSLEEAVSIDNKKVK